MFVLRHLIYRKESKAGVLISPFSLNYGHLKVLIKDCSKNNNLFEIVWKFFCEITNLQVHNFQAPELLAFKIKNMWVRRAKFWPNVYTILTSISETLVIPNLENMLWWHTFSSFSARIPWGHWAALNIMKRNFCERRGHTFMTSTKNDQFCNLPPRIWKNEK